MDIRSTKIEWMYLNAATNHAQCHAQCHATTNCTQCGELSMLPVSYSTTTAACIFWIKLFIMHYILVFTVQLCEAYTHAIAVDVCLSVKRVYYDKTKAPSEKCSIMTNRKSPMSFPMSLRWTSYIALNPPKGASKVQIWPIICNNFETVRDRM